MTLLYRGHVEMKGEGLETEIERLKGDVSYLAAVLTGDPKRVREAVYDEFPEPEKIRDFIKIGLDIQYDNRHFQYEIGCCPKDLGYNINIFSKRISKLKGETREELKNCFSPH